MESAFAAAKNNSPPREPASAEILNRLARLSTALRENVQSAGVAADKIVGPHPPEAISPGNDKPTQSSFIGALNDHLSELERLSGQIHGNIQRIHGAF